MFAARVRSLQRRHWRVLAFIAVVGLLAVLLLYQEIPALLSPWVQLQPAPLSSASQFIGWYEVQVGALACILGGGCLLALLWKPGRKPLLAQFLVVAFFIFVLVTLILFASNLTALLIVTMVLMGLFVAIYPWPRCLVSFSREGAFSVPLALLGLTTAVLLAPIFLHDLTYQLKFPTSLYAVSGSWIYSLMLTLLLAFGGLLSATKRAGWNILGIIVGITLLYLGVTALIAPRSLGSWGTVGGILAVAGGAAYIISIWYEVWRATKRLAEDVSSPASSRE